MNKPLFSVLLSSNGVEMHGERHGIAEADGSWLLNRVQKQLQSSRCRICGGQMALQHIFIQVFWFYLSVIIPSILHTYLLTYLLHGAESFLRS